MAKRIPPRLAGASQSEPDAARWQLGEFELDERRHELRRAGVVVPLEPKPLHLLMLLVRHPGELLTKEELIDRLWGGRVVSDSVIARAVTKLRHALGERQEWVRTIHGYGYRYDGWAEPLGGATGPSPALITVPEALPGKPGWQLLRRLGEGGDTWLAECKGTLRVFKLARDAARLTALKREAAVYRLLAAGSDGSVCTVALRDWNFHAPPYFLEFDYCEQGNLADWLRQQAGALSRVDRLALVANLADQLSALHALGVLHKDLKPANILVRQITQTRPELALADFGSGGLVEPERLRGIGLTRMGVTVSALDAPGSSGTPVYLAPEVIAGRPWTRQADLYALGVLLYQVLIDDLQRPLAPGWERDIDDPLLCEDIAAACDQSPAHRLADAAELAVRLRHLDKRRQRREAERLAAEEAEQLRASLATTRQRRRWQQAVLVSLAAGFAISSILYVDARAARQRAESANQTAQAVTRFLDESVLGAADPYRAGGGHQVTIASVLDTAVRDFDQLEQQPDLQLRLGLTLASAYHNLGLESQAQEVGGKAIAAGLKAGKAVDSAALNALRDQLAWIELNLARYPEAETQFRAMLDGADSPTTRYKAEYGLARVRFERGYFAQAAADYRQLLTQASPKEVDGWFLSDVRWDLAEAEFETHEWASAGAHLDEVQAWYRSRVPPNDPRQLWLQISTAYRLQMLESYPQAEDLLRDTQALAESALGTKHPVTMAARHHLGIVLNKQNRAAEALPLFQQVSQWRQQHYGEGHYLTRMSMSRVGESLILLGRAREAEPLLRRSWRASIDALGEDHPHTLDTQRLLAECQLAQGATSEAEALFRKVLDLGPHRLDASNNRLAWARYGLARTLIQRGEQVESQRLLTQASGDFRRNFSGRHSLIPVMEAMRAAPAATSRQATRSTPDRLS